MLNKSTELYFDISPKHQSLERENLKLKSQLKSAQHLITRLRNQVEDLKNQLKFLQLENQQLRQPHNSNQKTPHLSKSPKSKSNKSIKLVKDFHDQMEVFTSETDSDTQQCTHYRPTSSLIHPLGKQKPKNVYFEEEKGSSLIVKQKGSEIKLRGKASGQKSLRKIDSTNLFHPVTYFDVDPDQDNTFSSIQSRPLAQKSCVSMKNMSLTKSQRLIPIGPNNSYIKEQGKINITNYNDSPSHQKVFKKVNIAKPIYDVFFVTGLNTKGELQIIFNYPKSSQHFGPILTICYSQDFLKVKDNSASSKNLLNVSSQGNYGKVKEFYVIPLRKLEADSENDREYLAVCEVQQVILVPKDNTLVPCVFQRIYCFISSCQFFNCFKNLTNQFLDKISSLKNQSSQPYMSEQRYKKLLKQALEQPLMLLSQKSAQANHTLNYRLDAHVSLSIDIPSIDNSFKLVSQFRPWGVMNYKVHVRPSQDYVSNLETKLFGILLACILSEKKVILFSTVKSKISQTILHALEIIKPLEYVCPIIMTVLKQDHEEYFSAPMSLILGLWVEQKKLQKQKIQIFMNRKQNLAGMIQKGKIQIQDGVIINLDTGLIYGGGLSQNLTLTGILLNDYYENYCHHPKDIFKLFQKIFDKEVNKNQNQLVEIHRKLTNILVGTQLFTYFKEKAADKNLFYH